MVPWEGGGRVQWKQELVAAGLNSSLWWKGFLVGVHGKVIFLTHVLCPSGGRVVHRHRKPCSGAEHSTLKTGCLPQGWLK